MVAASFRGGLAQVVQEQPGLVQGFGAGGVVDGPVRVCGPVGSGSGSAAEASCGDVVPGAFEVGAQAVR